ncbi:MAG: hypothetical protein AB7O24_01155 [Kofleriaceae bacterium]
MGLPTSRERTYTTATPVDPNDMNAIQDAIIGRKYPTIYRWFGVGRGGLETNVIFDNGGGVYSGQIRSSSDNAEVDGIVIPGFEIGTLISGLAARVSGPGTSQTVQVILSVRGSLVGSLSIVNPGSEATYTQDPVTNPKVLGVGDVLVVKALLPKAATNLWAIGIGSSRL